MRGMLGEVANRVCKIGVKVRFTMSVRGMLMSLRIGWRKVLYISLRLLFIVVIYALLYWPR